MLESRPPASLLAGLRRMVGDPQTEITDRSCRPLAGGLSGSVLEVCDVTVRSREGARQVSVVHKLGAVVQGAFLHGAPRREAAFYRQFSHRIPLSLPRVVASDPHSGHIWMLPWGESKASSHWQAAWSAEDIRSCLADLAALHAAFWQQTAALAAHAWLWQPTGRDAGALLADARLSLATITAQGQYDDLLTPEIVQMWSTLAQQPRPLLAQLNEAPSTLLHGDAGFQNVAIAANDAIRIWYDWQLVGIGPAVLDVVTFLHPWLYPTAFPPLPPATMPDIYLTALREQGIDYPSDLFWRHLDAAALWRWLCQWAPLLGLYRQRLQPLVRERLYAVFARWQWPALRRWFRVPT